MGLRHCSRTFCFTYVLAASQRYPGTDANSERTPKNTDHMKQTFTEATSGYYHLRNQ